jgi:hypothetical protein
VVTLQQQLDDARAELNLWQSKEIALRADKNDADAAWLPNQASCRATYQEYENAKTAHVRSCAPKYYDHSCEKACVEAQGSIEFGCGVVEGAAPADIVSAGGVVANCDPPQPSWVLGPFTYGGSEDQTAQCTRIFAHQRPQKAQHILKHGWLLKKGRNGWDNWDRRYFVLESGDQVRSAVLRYFDKDPSKTPRSEWSEIEREDKAIILWDAKSTKVKEGTNYGFTDGSACFKLYHFYRDFRLCVPGVDYKSSASAERDEWMTLVQGLIRFPS